MTKIKVSGVPYLVEATWDTVDDAVQYYEGIIATLEQENKQMRARMNRLEEECNWLEAKTREIKQSTQGEH